jgi:hypothetical protein
MKSSKRTHGGTNIREILENGNIRTMQGNDRKLVPKTTNTQNILPVLKEAKSACLKHHLPTNRTEYTPIRGNPPCQQTASPTVRTELLDPSMNRSMLTPILKTAGLA